MPRRAIPLIGGEYYHVYNRGNNRQEIFYFHLLVCLHDDLFSRRMQQFAISYTKAMNERYHRVGALFQGQFQAIRVDSNDYLLHLSRYIHRNPLAANLVRKSEDWEFSSYREYLGSRQGTLVKPGIVLAQFNGAVDYRRFVEAYQPSDEATIKHLLFEE